MQDVLPTGAPPRLWTAARVVVLVATALVLMPYDMLTPSGRLDSTRLDSTRLDSTRLDSTRLDSTRLDST